MYKFLIQIGKKIFGTNSKKIADDLIKQGGKKTTQSKIPDGATVQKAPSVPNPRSPSTGKFAKPQPPAAPKASSPNPRTGRATKPANQTKSKTEVTTPKPKAKAPAVQTKAPKSTSGNSTGRGRPPKMPKSMVKERPNLPPRPKNSRPQGLRSTATPDVPEIDVTPPKGKSSGPASRPNNRPSDKPNQSSGPTSRPNNGPSDKPNKSSGPTSRPNNKPKTTKKSSTPATSPRPKARPTTASKPKAKTKAADPFANWSDARKKALRSDKIGKDAGDGMKWVVGSNSNALVRTRDKSKIENQLKLKKSLK